jgi:hypothetical protein
MSPDLAKRAGRIGNVRELKVLANGLRVEIEREARLAQRLQLTREEDSIGQDRVVQGLLAKAIARQQKLAFAGVPEGVGEHATQAGSARGAVFLIEMHQHFGIRPGSKPVPARLQRRTKLKVVVDLAVEDHPYGFVLVGDGLMSGVQVNDAEAPHADGAVAVQMVAFVVRAAVHNSAAHPLDPSEAGGRPGREESRDPTHANDCNSGLLVLVAD